MVKFIISIIFFLSLITNGCSSKKGITNPLIHDIWILESINGNAYVRASGQELHPTIEIYLSDERFGGNTGCNNMNGKVMVEGSTILFSDIVTTKMFCPDVDEADFLSGLGKANNYKIEKMKLYLYDSDHELLVFQKID
jgi:heat shock protein HslJ